MSVANNIKTQQEVDKKPHKRRRLRYNKWIVTNIPFYFFLAGLAIVYIANGHYADKVARKINKIEKEIKEMEYDYKTVKRDVIFRSKESELAKAVEPLGLKQLLIPPVRIIDTLVKK
ncbi:MAG: FtsL-like putative cell division protein [Ginsengibacter sp.]